MANTVIRDSTIRILQINPSLSYAEVGRLLGVSRQRICQVAGRQKRHPRFCRMCGRRIRLLNDGVTQTAYTEEFCAACWAAEKKRRQETHHRYFVCELCGTQFSRRAGAVKHQDKLGLKIRWCSKRCQGEWLATHGRLN
jgi:transcription elongation factor Elf1